MVGRRERYEARFHAMQAAKGGEEEEIYNVMVDRLSRALEDGDIDDGMDDSVSSIKSHREKAHILLHQATSSLSDRKKGSKPKAGNTSSHSRQQAAIWAKANSASIQPRGINRGGSRRKCFEAECDSDDSETEQEINTTRALLEEAASRLNQERSDLDAGINNIIYSRLMEELGVTNGAPSPSKNSNAKQRAERRALAAAGVLPISQIDESPASQRARREYAASMLAETKTKEQSAQPPLMLRNPLAASVKLERRHSAIEILKNLQENPYRRRSNPLLYAQSSSESSSRTKQPSRRRKSNPVLCTQSSESSSRAKQSMALANSGTQTNARNDAQDSDQHKQRPSRQRSGPKRDSNKGRKSDV